MPAWVAGIDSSTLVVIDPKRPSYLVVPSDRPLP